VLGEAGVGLPVGKNNALPSRAPFF
jgi:hypothetical protein